jgi:glycosyltransferase involved in cell wall biosynthesis
MKIAFSHDWLSFYSGGDKTLEAMLEHYPDAPVYTLIYQAENFRGTHIAQHPIHTSFIEKLPKGRKKYRSYLAFMPLAIEQFDLSEYDVLVSSSSAIAKGIITGPNQLHISYIHTPIRYAWDLQHQYLREANMETGIKSWLARWVLNKIRIWDIRTINGVDKMVANSHYIARRIRKVYGRKATVIYPPVDIDAFPLQEQKQDFFLTASRIVPYKKINLIVKAFNKMPEKRLVVIGDGTEFNKLKAIAGSNIELMGYQPDEVLRDKMQNARAFVFAAEEDFGITPVEAQSCGTPVIAFGKGGATETVIDGETGLFFSEQTEESIIEAVQRFEQQEFIPKKIHEHAKYFSKARFQNEMINLIETSWEQRLMEHKKTHPIIPLTDSSSFPRSSAHRYT